MLSVTPRQNLFPSDHDSLDVTFKSPSLSTKTPHPREQFIRLWRKTDWDNIRHVINVFPWCLLEDGSINDAANLFTDVILALIEDLVPKKPLSSRKFPPWYDSEVRLALKNKKNVRGLSGDYFQTNTPIIPSVKLGDILNSYSDTNI